MPPGRYLRTLLLACAITLISAAALNYAVDPYGLYRRIEVAGFNAVKPKSGANGQLVKPYRVIEARPRTLVLGNSRSEAGLDPASALWPDAMRPVYNFSLPASGISTALGNLRHVLAAGKPGTVILGIDFFDFVTDRRRAGASRTREPTDLERRYLVTGDGSRNDARDWQVMKDHATVLLSLNTLIDAFVTVGAQRMSDNADLTALGFYPMHEYRRFVRADGQHTMFRQVETTYLTSYLRLQPTIHPDGDRSSPELRDFAAVVSLCRTEGVNLIVFIHPYHAHILESYRAAGLWPLFEAWKRDIVALLEADRAAHPDLAPIPLWDFSGYTGITTEAVPPAGDRKTTMQGYWEAGHYNSAVGDLALARMLGSAGVSVPDEFGVRLAPAMLESHLARIRDDRERYAAARAEEVAGIGQLADSLREKLKAAAR